MSARATSVRIFLVDDHPLVLDGLEQLFRLEPDFEIVGRARDGANALERLLELEPDLAIVDLRMPGLSGLELLARLEEAASRTRVLLLTAAVENSEVVEAMRRGARGLVLKETAPELVIRAARRVHAGGQWFDQEMLSRALDSVSTTRGSGVAEREALTQREREVARMVTRGLRNRAIAETLGISEGTVKLHLHHVYDKLALTSRLELLLYAQKNEL